jgi:uncharacterized protein YacL
MEFPEDTHTEPKGILNPFEGFLFCLSKNAFLMDINQISILKKGGDDVFMKNIIVILLAVILTFFSWSTFAVSLNKFNHLFFIERSKNKNYIQYDVRLTENSDLLDSSPITVY